MTQEVEQKKRPIFRHLRIAFSALCGIACLLLIVLWVRSYTARDMVRGVLGRESIHVTSLRGQVAIAVVDWPHKPYPWIFDSKSDKLNMVAVFPTVTGNPPLSWIGFRWHFAPTLLVCVLPYWFLVLLSALLTPVLWMRWRYSLRTMLIGMTLVAALLGLLAI